MLLRVYAGRPANWLMVGFGGYDSPSRVSRKGSLPPDDVNAFTPGITLRCLAAAEGSQIALTIHSED